MTINVTPVRIPRMESQTEAYIRKTLDELHTNRNWTMVCETKRIWVKGYINIPLAPIQDVSTEWFIHNGADIQFGFNTEDVYHIYEEKGRYWVVQLYSRHLPKTEEEMLDEMRQLIINRLVILE